MASRKNFILTTGVDTFTGGAGADTFNATNTGAAQSLSSYDTIKGGAGADVLNIFSLGYAYEETGTYGVTVSGIETAILKSDRKVVLNTITWTDLTNLTVFAVGATSGATSVTAATTTAVSVTNLNSGGNSTTVNGGSSVNVAAFDATGGGAINVGNTTSPKGAVTITSTNTANNTTSGSINVKGGTKIQITTTQSNSVNTTNTNGTVDITGSADTKAVSVTNAAKATASATVAGVTLNSVSIADVNGGIDVPGKITSAIVNNFSTLGISDNALKNLTVSGGRGNIIIDNSGLTTPTNKTLALSISGQTSGTLDDADIYTTLNVTTTGVDSTLSNITFGGMTTLNVAGTKVLTLTSTTGATALKTVNVSGTAGITASLTGSTVTAVNTTASTGTSKVTVDASIATYTGGKGVDNVTNSVTTSTKVISLGGGDDSLTMTSISATPTAAITGGMGTDTLTMTAARAATESGGPSFAGVVTGFEHLTLTSATNQTIDLAVLGNFNYLSTSGGNGFTLSKLPTGGTLALTGAGTAYTISNSAFLGGLTDTVKLNLTDGSGSGVSFASTGITASGVENFVITTADTQATPSGTFMDTLTVLGNSVKSITVSGNAGLTLTATSTALTNVDASGISLGGFTYTSGSLAAASVIKGSATGTNTVDVSAAIGGAVTYTGGRGADSFTATNSQTKTINLGDGTNSATLTSGNNTIKGGKDADTVIATTGNNTVNLGNGTNSFTATTGNNTYIGGTGVDTVTVGGGSNTLKLGTGADVVSITAVGVNLNTFTTITDPGKGDTISFVDKGTETFATAKLTLPNSPGFQDYVNAVIQAGGNASVNGAFGWFQFSGDTYLVQSRHDGSGGSATFVDGTDMIVKLTGLVDLSTVTGGTTNILTLA